MKKMIVLMALALCGAAVFAQQPKLVVTPVENRGSKLDSFELENLQDYLINAFVNLGNLQVPDRSALALIASEQKFQLSDWSDDRKSTQMGKVLNANYIARVIATHDGEVYVLTVRILDINTANGLAAEELEFSSQRDARNKMEAFVVFNFKSVASYGIYGRVYKAGSRGPAGGWVFYDKGSISNGWQFLEAAPVSTEFTSVQ